MRSKKYIRCCANSNTGGMRAAAHASREGPRAEWEDEKGSHAAVWGKQAGGEKGKCRCPRQDKLVGDREVNTGQYR